MQTQLKNTTHSASDDWHEAHAQLQRVQKKSLEISNPGDSDETEADEVARKVMQNEPATIQTASSGVNRKEDGNAEASAEFQSQLESKKGSGSPLDSEVRSEMESKMGADFSNVKIHTGSDAGSMSDRIHAEAFTHGQDVFFNQGQYNPSSAAGKELLAHELVHTVQQSGAVSRKIQRRMLSKEPVADKIYEDKDKVKDYYVIVPDDVKQKVVDETKKWYSGVKTQLSTDLPAYNINELMAFKDESEAESKALEILQDMHDAMQSVWAPPPNNPMGSRVQSHKEFDFKFDTLQDISNSVLFRLSEVQNMHFANRFIFARYPDSEDVKNGTAGFNMRTDKLTPTPLQTGKVAPPGDRGFFSKEGVTPSQVLDDLTSHKSTRTEKEEKKGQNYNADQRILIDCRTMITLVQYMSMRQVMPDDNAFDKKFEKSGFVLAPFGTPTKEKGAAPVESFYDRVEIMSLDDLVVGDIVNFVNKSDYTDFTKFNSGLLWSSEWAQYKGKDNKGPLFEGFGAVHHYDDMNTALMEAYEAGYDSVKNDAGFKTTYGEKKYDFKNRTNEGTWAMTIDGYTPGLHTTIFRANVNRMTKPPKQ